MLPVMSRRRLIRSAVWGSTATLAPLGLQAARTDGEHLAFGAYRNGDHIGEHHLTFAAASGRLQVAIDIRFAVKFALLTVYSYRHQSRETWRDGRLVALAATTDDDGERSTVRARADGEWLVVEAGGGSRKLPADLLPTSYWHESTIARGQWLNTQDGRVVRSTVDRLGPDRIEALGRAVTAMRYRLRGDLDCDLWYRDGQWTKLRFTASDGSTIDYVLESARFGSAARFQPRPAPG